MAQILGLDQGDIGGLCFREIADAVSALTVQPVVFQAHRYLAPPGSIVYHWENGPLQHRASLANAARIWDFSRANVERYPSGIRAKVAHVPCGFHRSMVRFKPDETPHHDVVWIGCLNPRRQRILDGLRSRGLSVVEVPWSVYGRQRNTIVARARVLLNMRYYEDGLFPVLRSAYAAANSIPCVAEISPEIPDWAVERVGYDRLVSRVFEVTRSSVDERSTLAAKTFSAFRRCPLALP